jgi:hypothetical protein
MEASWGKNERTYLKNNKSKKKKNPKQLLRRM